MPAPLHRVLVNTVVHKDGKFLLLRRSLQEEHMPGKWTIPGGKVEHTAEDTWDILEKTAAREVKEESGAEIENIRMIANNSFIHTSGDHVVAIVFLADYRAGYVRPQEESMAVQWVARVELDQYDFAPNVRSYLEKAIQYNVTGL